MIPVYSRLARATVVLAVLALLAVAPLIGSAVGLSPDLLTRILIWGIFGLGFSLLFGSAGLLSFGQAAFFGIGGYVAAYLLSQGLVSDAVLALLAGTIAGAFGGLAVGYLALRRTGIYFAMCTLAFAEMFYFLVHSPLKAWTRGDNGISGIPPARIGFGAGFEIEPGLPMYVFTAVLFLLAFLIAQSISRSPFGMVLNAIRENPVRAAAVGHAVGRYKLAVFVIAAAYAGLAGGLLSIFQSYMPPDVFRLETSGQLVVQTVLGGAGSLFGPLIGAALWLTLYEALQSNLVLGQYWKLILGLLFVAMVAAFPRGIMGAVREFLGARPGRRADSQEVGDVVVALPPAPRRSGGEGGPILVARGLSKRYGAFQAVSDVDLEIRAGEIRGLIGPNGAGKSTLFKMLAGEVLPTSGHILLSGEDVTACGLTATSQRGLTKSFQINQLFEQLSVRENLRAAILARSQGAFRLDLLATSASDPTTREADTLVHLLGLAAGAERLVAALSYGEKRRLEIGLAVATGAGVILLDEPLAGMSPEERIGATALLKRIAAERTLVIVEHDTDALFELASAITVLTEGRILAHGTPAEIRSNKSVQDAYLGGMKDAGNEMHDCETA